MSATLTRRCRIYLRQRCIFKSFPPALSNYNLFLKYPFYFSECFLFLRRYNLFKKNANHTFGIVRRLVMADQSTSTLTVKFTLSLFLLSRSLLWLDAVDLTSSCENINPSNARRQLERTQVRAYKDRHVFGGIDKLFSPIHLPESLAAALPVS